VLAATPTAWTTGRIAIPADCDGTTIDDGTEVVAQPLGEGMLLIPARGGRRRARAGCFRISLLGRTHATFTGPGGTQRLSSRHSEIVALLALHADGIGSKELAELLYNGPGHEVSARAELHRLRGILGPALETRPYRLADTDVDLRLVRDLLARDQRAQAVRAYTGPLLPGSTVPAIEHVRRELQAQIDALSRPR